MGKRAVKATKAILGHPVGQLNLSGRHFRGSVSVFSNFFFFIEKFSLSHRTHPEPSSGQMNSTGRCIWGRE
jgi:hypothetical protein